MSSAELVLLTANAVYGTAYVAMRPAVDAFGPVTLAFLRLAIGFAIVAPLGFRARGPGTASLSGADRRALFWMGFLGFTLAMALTHWGLAWSTATNAALLIATEPIALVVLAPIVLGEHLTRREGWGTALALLGATVIVVNGVPGLTVALAPHWRGDLLLLLSGVCFAAYSLLGRPLLARHPSIRVTAWSFLWGVVTTAPLAAVEWQAGGRSPWTAASVAAVLYLGIVITGARVSRLELGARAGRRVARGDLSERPAARRRAARRRVARRAPVRLHRRRRDSRRPGALARRDRPPGLRLTRPGSGDAGPRRRRPRTWTT